MILFKVKVIDPRINVIGKRLKDINRIVMVAGGKGGIGKSVIASGLALCLDSMNRNVGILDLDLYGPSCHLILGVKDVYPKEEKGIIPPEVNGIKFMSIIYYTMDNPFAVRGTDISNSIIEILAITRWGELDFLIVDMPPGIGDTILDMNRLLPKAEFIVITTPSNLVFDIVKRTIKLLQSTYTPILGVIENSVVEKSDSLHIKEKVSDLGIKFLGSIEFDPHLESCIGEKEKLLSTRFVSNIKEIILNYF